MLAVKTLGLRILAVVPVAVLVTVVGLLVLLGLFCRQPGRSYVRHVIYVVLAAACALMSGHRLTIPPPEP